MASYFDLLPRELKEKTIYEVAPEEIGKVCKNEKFSSFCQQPDFWLKKAAHDMESIIDDKFRLFFDSQFDNDNRRKYNDYYIRYVRSIVYENIFIWNEVKKVTLYSFDELLNLRNPEPIFPIYYMLSQVVREENDEIVDNICKIYKKWKGLNASIENLDFKMLEKDYVQQLINVWGKAKPRFNFGVLYETLKDDLVVDDEVIAYDGINLSKYLSKGDNSCLIKMLKLYRGLMPEDIENRTFKQNLPFYLIAAEDYPKSADILDQIIKIADKKKIEHELDIGFLLIAMKNGDLEEIENLLNETGLTKEILAHQDINPISRYFEYLIGNNIQVYDLLRNKWNNYVYFPLDSNNQIFYHILKHHPQVVIHKLQYEIMTFDFKALMIMRQVNFLYNGQPIKTYNGKLFYWYKLDLHPSLIVH